MGWVVGVANGERPTEMMPPCHVPAVSGTWVKTETGARGRFRAILASHFIRLLPTLFPEVTERDPSAATTSLSQWPAGNGAWPEWTPDQAPAKEGGIEPQPVLGSSCRSLRPG